MFKVENTLFSCPAKAHMTALNTGINFVDVYEIGEDHIYNFKETIPVNKEISQSCKCTKKLFFVKMRILVKPFAIPIEMGIFSTVKQAIDYANKEKLQDNTVIEIYETYIDENVPVWKRIWCKES